MTTLSQTDVFHDLVIEARAKAALYQSALSVVVIPVDTNALQSFMVAAAEHHEYSRPDGHGNMHYLTKISFGPVLPTIKSLTRPLNSSLSGHHIAGLILEGGRQEDHADIIQRLTVVPSNRYRPSYFEDLELLQSLDSSRVWQKDVSPCRFASVGEFADVDSRLYELIGNSLLTMEPTAIVICQKDHVIVTDRIRSYMVEFRLDTVSVKRQLLVPGNSRSELVVRIFDLKTTLISRFKPKTMFVHRIHEVQRKLANIIETVFSEKEKMFREELQHVSDNAIRPLPSSLTLGDRMKKWIDGCIKKQKLQEENK